MTKPTSKIRKLLTMNIVDLAQALQSLHVPGRVITDDLSANWIEVGEGNIIRVEVSAATYFAFSDLTTGGAVSSTTTPAVKLSSGDHYIICQSKYIRSSANPTRVELLEI